MGAKNPFLIVNRWSVDFHKKYLEYDTYSETSKIIFGEKLAFPRTIRRISENCFCLNLTGKLRRLWSFVFLCKALNSHSTSFHPVGVGSVANCQWSLMKCCEVTSQWLVSLILGEVMTLLVASCYVETGISSGSVGHLARIQTVPWAFFLPLLSHQRMVKVKEN